MSVAQEVAIKSRTSPAHRLKVSVSHPHGNANSYHAALALSESQWLACFETGILDSSTSSIARRLSPDLEKRARNRSFEGIPEARKNSHRTFELLSRAGRKLKPRGLTSQINWYDLLFCGHDFQISRSMSDEADAVYAYEDAARLTFESAKRNGASAIYELPLGYYKAVAREINRAREERPGMLALPVYEEPIWKKVRKDAELALADVVVVASDWARESLRLSGTASGKPIVTVPYGTPAEEILPRSQRPSGPFTVLFAGQVGLRKGVPHLIEAWEKLNLSNARLLLAGSMNLPGEYLKQHSASFEYLGALPREEMLELMARVDLFAFPSLADGFGLVIGEAMAKGVPVLTTTNTGGPHLITDGVEGWCVQSHAVEPLVERLEWGHEHRDRLYEMGQLARERAERWTWSDYRRRLIDELSPYLVSRKERKDSQRR